MEANSQRWRSSIRASSESVAGDSEITAGRSSSPFPEATVGRRPLSTIVKKRERAMRERERREIGLRIENAEKG